VGGNDSGGWIAEAGFSVTPGGFRSGHVDEGTPGGGDQPAFGIRRWVGLPRAQRPEQGLLYRVLGGGEIRPTVDEDVQDLRGKLPQPKVVDIHSIKLGRSVRKGRTSSHSWIGRPPAPGAADISPAISIARS
jgi:hypothetical protein